MSTIKNAMLALKILLRGVISPYANTNNWKGIRKAKSPNTPNHDYCAGAPAFSSKPFNTPCVSLTNALLFSRASLSPSVSTASNFNRTSFMIVSDSFLCSKSLFFGSSGGDKVYWTQSGKILVWKCDEIMFNLARAV